MRTALATSPSDGRWNADEQRPIDNLTLAFRGVAARFRMRGLRDSALRRLYSRYLADQAYPAEGARSDNENIDELHDLVALLLMHRSDDSEESEWLACAVATACFGGNHLWQDMGLPSRAVLSELLRSYFAALYAKNTGNMKWKKFFYKQLCEQIDINVCKAPSCKVCADYAQCFGPEESSPELLPEGCWCP